LAALALPTLKRSLGALIDWFTLAFFSLCALAIWVVWVAMQTGTPAKPAANVARLAPEFVPELSVAAFALALAATVGWAGLVKWRTGYHRAALWKSMVLPAGGAVLCWLLLTTLWLPLLDYARSYVPLMAKVTQVTGRGVCLQYAGISKAQGAALMHHAQARLLPMQTPLAECPWLVVERANLSLLIEKIQSLGWVEQAAIKRPTDKDETLAIFRPAQALNAASVETKR
jgi:hypothetical protein